MGHVCATFSIQIRIGSSRLLNRDFFGVIYHYILITLDPNIRSLSLRKFYIVWLLRPSFGLMSNPRLSNITGTSMLGPFALRESVTQRTISIWPVGIPCLLLAVVPPYILVGVVFGGLLAPSQLRGVFIVTLCIIIPILIGTLSVVIFHLRRRTPTHASYAFDVIAEMKVSL